MKTIIFGKESNLTQSLKKKINKKSLIVSSRDYFKKPNKYQNYFTDFDFNLIINGFSPSFTFKSIISYEKFIKESINSLVILLERVDKKKIKKIIFSSSSSVSNFISNNNNSQINTSLQATSKLLMENIIIDFCLKNKIQYLICRISNIFGGNDKFSIINYLTSKNNFKIQITNNGNPSRDFIHVDEVANIYIKLLNISELNGVVNIGSGKQVRIREIIDKYNLKNKVRYSNKNINETILYFHDISLISNFYQFNKKLSINYYLNKILNKKVVLDTFSDLSKNNTIKFVCYGTGVAASQMFNLKNTNYSLDSLSFFVDDDKNLIGKKYLGKPILSLNQLKLISNNYVIKEIVIAISNISEKFKIKLFDKLINISNKVTTIPIKSKLLNRKLTSFDLKETDFEYLFKKNSTTIAGKILSSFNNKNILITGGAGSIGSELVNQLIKNKYTKIVVLDNSEYALYLLKKQLESNNFNNCEIILGDINDYDLIKYLFNKYSFDFVYHSAAYKHVNLLEDNVIAAIKNNVLSTNLLLQVCSEQKHNIKFTFISTDKADNPKSILGYSKRAAEIVCQYFNQYKNIKINIVRFGNVFASRGSAIHLFIKQIRDNESVTITNKKVERFFMSIRQACSLVIKSSNMNLSNGRIYVLDMGKSIKIIDLVNRLHSVYGDSNKLKIKEIGLQKGEKLKETLSHKKKLIKSNTKDIFFIYDNFYSSKKIKTFINETKDNINNYNYKHFQKLKSLVNIK